MRRVLGATVQGPCSARAAVLAPLLRAVRGRIGGALGASGRRGVQHPERRADPVPDVPPRDASTKAALKTAAARSSAPPEGITFLTAILDTRYLGTANTYRYSILDT